MRLGEVGLRNRDQLAPSRKHRPPSLIAPKFPLHTFSHALQDASAANAMAADRCARLSNTSQRSQTSSNPSGDLAGVGGVKGHQVTLLVWVG